MSKKILGVGVVLALVAAVFVGVASTVSAQSMSLCQTVDALVAAGVIAPDKVAAAKAAAGCGATSSACYSFTKDLTVGSTGADVSALQAKLSVSPATGYFGAITKAAVQAYQTSKGISATGYVGPLTRAALNACVVTTTTTTTTTTNTSTSLSGGEASLENFDISSGDDDEIEEGDSAEIAEIEFDVEDADAVINRVDLQFENASTTDTTDLWDVLEKVELVIDGKTVGSADLSDEDEYLDEDDGTVRISGIDYKVEEGETVTIVVNVTSQDNVDDEDQDTFTVAVVDDGIRATDGDDLTQEIGSDSETVSFSVEEAGSDEELNVSTSSEDPDEDTLKAEDDNKSDMYELFAFDLEAEENDIEINTVTVIATSSVALSNVVSDWVIEIDGEEFDDWSYVTGGSASTTRQVEFDIDGDYTIDADSEVTVVVKAEFKAANGSNYSSGATIAVGIVDNGVEGEGADDIESDGVASGETHTIATEGIVVLASNVTTETDTQGDGDTVGIFTIDFKVTAFEEDFYIAAAASTTASVSTGGVEFASLGSGTTTATLASTADEDTTNVFTVKEGETETFTLTVTFDPASAGQYRLTLEEIWSSTVSDGVTSSTVKNVEATDFRTDYENIN